MNPGSTDVTSKTATATEIAGAVITVAIGYFLQYRARQRAHAEPVDLAAGDKKE